MNNSQFVRFQRKFRDGFHLTQDKYIQAKRFPTTHLYTCIYKWLTPYDWTYSDREMPHYKCVMKIFRQASSTSVNIFQLINGLNSMLKVIFTSCQSVAQHENQIKMVSSYFFFFFVYWKIDFNYI